MQQCFTVLWQLLVTLLIPRCSTFVITRRAWRHDSSFIALNVFTITDLPTPCVVPVTWLCSFECFYQLPGKSLDIAKNSSARSSSTAVRCLNQCFFNIFCSWLPLSLMNLCAPPSPSQRFVGRVLIYNFNLSRRLNSIKYSRTSSGIRWLASKPKLKTTVDLYIRIQEYYLHLECYIVFKYFS